MVQLGFLDFDIRLHRIDKAGDPLTTINKTIDWEIFRPIIEKARAKEKKSNAGATGFDAILLFKILILQSLYNLSDEGLEYQILDRYSFSRFLGLHAASKVPDCTTIWRFRNDLANAGVVELLFSQFNGFLLGKGFRAQKGQIVDANIVSVPIQRNSRDENQQITAGKEPEDWNTHKRCQKDTEARWTKKNGRNFFGYKNHISTDVKYKLIRRYAVSSAEVHDSNVFEELIDPANTSRDIWADSAYRSQERITDLQELGYREHIQRKGCRNKKLTDWEKQGNRTRAKIRSRVDHIFGVQAQRAGTLLLRGIGIVRAKAKIGLRNLAYNLSRYSLLATVHRCIAPCCM
jgi:transposase, IS5 family